MGRRRVVAMGVTMGVGVPVVVSMVVGMGVSHPEMLYYNITGVHGPKPKPIALCGLHQYGPSKSVLCPDGADFFIRREVATLSLSQRSVEIGFFFGRQHIGRLRHARNIAASGPRGKRCARPHGFPIAIASAAPSRAATVMRRIDHGAACAGCGVEGSWLWV